MWYFVIKIYFCFSLDCQDLTWPVKDDNIWMKAMTINFYDKDRRFAAKID